MILMAPFTPNSRLQVEDSDGFPFILLRDLVFTSREVGLIMVPAGFSTDYASIPRVLWSVLPPIGRYDRAAVLHDYLYRVGHVTRSQADGVLKEAMEDLAVRATQRWAIYAGVRAGGWRTWNRYRSAGEVIP